MLPTFCDQQSADLAVRLVRLVTALAANDSRSALFFLSFSSTRVLFQPLTTMTTLTTGGVRYCLR
jgi:hypothetical protein